MNTKTALVVDDSKSARFALRRFLENHHYTVVTAESAAEAYSHLRGELPQVIFLDQVMPGINGFEALHQLKSQARTREVPVVICSSNEGDAFNAEARAAGAAAVLQKPPSAEQLARILRQLQKNAARAAAAAAAPAPAPEPAPAPAAANPALTQRVAELEARNHALEQRMDEWQQTVRELAAALQKALARFS